MKSFLVVAQEKDLCLAVQESLRPESEFSIAESADVALDILRNKRYDCVLVDLPQLRASMTSTGYKEALQPFWNLYPTLEIIVMAPSEMIREAVMAVKAGASNYITYPVNPDEVRFVTENIYASVIVQHELDYLRDQFWVADSQDIIKTNSPLMKKVFEKVRHVAPTKSTVLLIGETGTGKGVLAQLIHKHSNRRDGPYVSVHCGAIPDTLLESELFGHEKGAFTGAVRRKLGRFEIAKGGTIFLDEVGTITSSAQIKLLQILQDGTFQRVGGEQTLEANVRIVAATNTDLKTMCDNGQFRKDLYYRLNVFPIEIPPLSQRKEDIPHFVEIFLKKLNQFNSKEIRDIHPHVFEAFKQYPWQGNIRELENLIERGYILETSSTLSPDSFPSELFPDTGPLATVPVDASRTLAEVRRNGVEDIERRYLRELLAENRGKINESAAQAGVSTRQLHKLLTKYGIQKREFKS
jgi:DNA-binding NtrC family response regulator